MKNIGSTCWKNKYFIVFILCFAYAESIYSRVLIRGELNKYIFTPDAALAKLVEIGILFSYFVFFIKHTRENGRLSIKKMLLLFGSSVVAFILTTQTLGLLISFLFGNIEQNFNWETILLSSFTYLLDGFIYGSFIIAYYYFHKNKQHHEQLVNFTQALSESRIRQLKTQLNPHFLFNNLNVLDQLIDEDKNKASEFLNEFADIYRYVLQATDLKLVPISTELAFAQQYFKLIQHKYGEAYQMKIENTSTGMIVPLTLQLLIENAIQHNIGSAKNPIHIKIELTDTITVTNNFNPNKNIKPSSGRGLKNIKEQYKLLTEKPLLFQKLNDEFYVRIPIIEPQ